MRLNFTAKRAPKSPKKKPAPVGQAGRAYTSLPTPKATPLTADERHRLAKLAAAGNTEAAALQESLENGVEYPSLTNQVRALLRG